MVQCSSQMKVSLASTRPCLGPHMHEHLYSAPVPDIHHVCVCSAKAPCFRREDAHALQTRRIVCLNRHERPRIAANPRRRTRSPRARCHVRRNVVHPPISRMVSARVLPSATVRRDARRSVVARRNA